MRSLHYLNDRQRAVAVKRQNAISPRVDADNTVPMSYTVRPHSLLLFAAFPQVPWKMCRAIMCAIMWRELMIYCTFGPKVVHTITG